MTSDLQALRPVGRPATENAKDRTARLEALSEELRDRLSRYPVPRCPVLPMAGPPSRWRLLGRTGLPAAIVVAATAIAIASPWTPWRQVEKASEAVTPAADKLVALPLAPAAVAAAPAAYEPSVTIVLPVPVVAAEMQSPLTIVPEPAIAPKDRALTWSEVHELQARLRALKFDPGPLDGISGPLTSAAVRRFQEAHGGSITGDTGIATLVLLRQAMAGSD